MAAYYQPQISSRRQPLAARRDDRDDTPTPPSPESHQKSYLIFPAPPIHEGAPSSLNVPPASNESKPPSSPTGSALSLQTSLLSSFAAQSSRAPNSPTGSGGGSVEAGREAESPTLLPSEWEELRPGPLPRPRGRTRRPRDGSVQRTWTESTERKKFLERKGSGWAWTLDVDDMGGAGGIDGVGWSWTAGSSNGGEGVEGDTKYEDASSQFHSLTNGSEDESNGSEDAESEANKIHFTGGRRMPQHYQPRTPRRYSFKLMEPIAQGPQYSMPPRASRKRSVSRSRHTSSSLSSFPFGSFIQALFSIDPATIKLLNQSSSETSQTRPSALFDLSEEVVDSEENLQKTIIPTQPDHALRQQVELLTTDSGPSPQAATAMIKKGLVATHSLPKNPFTFPFYLLDWSWEGWRGYMTFEDRATDKE